MILAIAAFLLVGQSIVEEDRAAFEKSWSETASESLPLISKSQAWRLWGLMQSQFSLGFCSEFIPATSLDSMRRFPNESQLSATKFGQTLLRSSRKMFDSGVAYRNEVTPTILLCNKEIASLTAVLNDIDQATANADAVKAGSSKTRVEVDSWFRADDYPASALRLREEGETHVRFRIGQYGRVDRCEIVVSSGSKSLDRAACSVITRRGNALWLAGRTVEHVVNWKLPNAGR